MRAITTLSLAALALAARAEEPPPAGSGPITTDVAVAGAAPVAPATATHPDVVDSGAGPVAATAGGGACEVCWDANCPDLKSSGLPACPASDAATAAKDEASPKKESERRSGDAGTVVVLGPLHGSGAAVPGGLLGAVHGPRDPASAGGLGAPSDRQTEHDARTRAVVSGEPTIVGGLDRAAVVRVVQASRSSLLYCYERRLLEQPTLAGEVRLHVAVGGDGQVTNVTVLKDDLGGSDVARCLAGRAERWTFPAPAGAGAATVTYPLRFTPRE